MEEAEESLLLLLLGLCLLLVIMAVAFLAVLMLVVVLVAVAVGIVAFLVIMMMVSAAALAVFVVVLVVMVVIGTEASVLVDEIRETVMVVLVTLTVGIIALLAILVDMVVLVTVAVRVIAFIVIMVFVTVAVRIVALLTVVMMVMVVLEGFPVDGVIETGIVDGMEHLVGELVLVDIQDGTHEVEFHFVGTVHGSVVLDSVVHVDEVEGDTLSAVDVDGCLDVSQEASGLALYELSDGHEGISEPLLRIGVEVEDATGESSCASACLFH